jgi:hypothetical protein
MSRSVWIPAVAILGTLALAACQGPVGLVSRIEAPRLVSPPSGARMLCLGAGGAGARPSQEPSPAPTSTPQPNELAWTNVRGVGYYQVEIYRAADARLVVTRRVDPGDAQEIRLNCGADYQWRVAAVAEYPADPAWSDVWLFTIEASSAGATTFVVARAR